MKLGLHPDEDTALFTKKSNFSSDVPLYNPAVE